MNAKAGTARFPFLNNKLLNNYGNESTIIHFGNSDLCSMGSWISGIQKLR